MLNTYSTRLQTILHDFSGTLYGSPLSSTALINQARARVALQGQCIRVLPPSSGSVASATITAHGSGYTSATVAISGPALPNGVPATAFVSVGGGQVIGLTIINPGSGYVSPPTATISGNGTGAVAQLFLTGLNATAQGQEKYNFASMNGNLPAGVTTIQNIFSVAVSQGNTRPMMRYMSFSEFQAYCRIFEGTQQDYPAVWSQYGQGALGSLYLFPIPSGTYSMDWDCVCLPADLNSDSDPEAIPYPWTEAVSYYAAYLCYQYAQRNDDAKNMLSEYNRLMLEARAWSASPAIPDIYEDDD